jgi:hypothetical protein
MHDTHRIGLAHVTGTNAKAGGAPMMPRNAHWRNASARLLRNSSHGGTAAHKHSSGSVLLAGT